MIGWRWYPDSRCDQSHIWWQRIEPTVQKKRQKAKLVELTYQEDASISLHKKVVCLKYNLVRWQILYHLQIK